MAASDPRGPRRAAAGEFRLFRHDGNAVRRLHRGRSVQHPRDIGGLLHREGARLPAPAMSYYAPSSATNASSSRGALGPPDDGFVFCGARAPTAVRSASRALRRRRSSPRHIALQCTYDSVRGLVVRLADRHLHQRGNDVTDRGRPAYFARSWRTRDAHTRRLRGACASPRDIARGVGRDQIAADRGGASSCTVRSATLLPVPRGGIRGDAYASSPRPVARNLRPVCGLRIRFAVNEILATILRMIMLGQAGEVGPDNVCLQRLIQFVPQRCALRVPTKGVIFSPWKSAISTTQLP